MLRIIGATKWAIHPEGGKTKIVKPRGGVSSYPPPILPNGGGLFNRENRGEGSNIPYTQQKKYFASHYYHKGGGRAPLPQ